MDLHGRVYVAGHRGLVGSALVRRLQAAGTDQLVLRSHAELDLTDQNAVDAFFAAERPDHVFLAAAKVGGIHANATYPAEFIQANLAIQTNVIHSAWKHGTKKLLFLGSSCIYPRDCPQPIKEDYLLTGPLEASNESYAIAKIAGIKLCQAYRAQYGFDAICAMPTNLYGPGDNFDLQNSHVLPALIRRFHEARTNGAPEVVLWGTGTPRREFLFVDDLADAALFLMERYSDAGIVNVGTGRDIAIKELACMVAEIVGYSGAIVYDATRLDGTPRKLLDIDRVSAMGWAPRMGLRQGIEATYLAYRATCNLRC